MKCILPAISNCNVSNCAYNKLNKCHALAVTIGDGDCPACDTSMLSAKKGGLLEVNGGVGACKVDSCKYNDALECTANTISVQMNSDHAECNTYASR